MPVFDEPNDGTAGSPSPYVVTVQGITGGTVLPVSMSNTPLMGVSGSVFVTSTGSLAVTMPAVQLDKGVASSSYVAIAGLDGGKIIRAARVGEFGTQRTTSEQLVFMDAFEGSSVNSLWTQSTTTLTIAQANGVLSLNNASATTLNTYAIVTSAKQHPKYARQPLYGRFRANISANVAGNHTLVELGFGAPTTNTAIISNGAFFRWRVDGTLAVVLAYNGTEQVVQVLAQGVISTTSYYYYDIIVDDDYARFIVSDSSSVPIVDTSLALTLTVPYMFAASHAPSFARVYVDATGGGTAIKLNISAHTVQIVDALNNVPWNYQLVGAGKGALLNPISGSQTTQLATGAAPTAFTPSNTVGGNQALGGEALCNATATSENLLSVFCYPIPAPYAFYLTDIYVGTPLNTVVAVATTATIMEWFLIANCSSTNISTGGGQRMVIPNSFYTAAVATAANTLFSGTPTTYSPNTPILCLPGTFLHIGYKIILGTATATEVYRCNVAVNGFFM